MVVQSVNILKTTEKAQRVNFILCDLHLNKENYRDIIFHSMELIV